MILDTPKDRMRNDHDCGGCSLAVVFGFHGLVLPEAHYALCSPAFGISPYTCEAVLQSHFAGLSQGCGWSIADLQFHTEQGRPVMALVSVDEAHDHWVVVRGVENGKVHYHDPAYGRRSKSVKAWLKWWGGPEAASWQNFGLVAWMPSVSASGT